MKRKARLETALGDLEMDLKRAILLQDVLDPVGRSARRWRAARDLTYEVVKTLITPSEGAGGFVKFSLRATAVDLGISVDELSSLLEFADRGDYPQELLILKTREVFSVADVGAAAEPPPQQKPRGNSHKDSLASLRQRISY